MNFLVRHWHCIIPVIAVFAALFLMRNKNKTPSETKNYQEEGESHEE